MRDEFELGLGEDLPPLPSGAPPDFRVRLAVSLKTMAPEVLAAAEEGFRGVFSSGDEYIRDIVGYDIPDHLQWILACVAPDLLRRKYENGVILVWEIQLDDCCVMVFESFRRGSVQYHVPVGTERVAVYAKAAVTKF